ncbi:Conserved hypothetical periplasmic protein [Zobellia galactanivorans]|uniref:Conserved hypothetical periplasmic protein n=2 Tax=Zobellia galactanivorans (strain DSM 12802 / CCUG 47099 / CIP 106680 / NCIMB 13871 / Dsij) TaxID=63186 RepID=G0L4B2_ZOBGA|nr:hypothetical protein [Zobellia sp. OII3]CAZ95603.1 Conserved hypothetical periplasmic protein [Zobellia galactanivorans]
MKTQSITLILLFLCSLSMAQQQPNTIRVSARAIYIDPDPVFKADVSLTDSYSDQSINKMQIDQMRAHFKKIIEDNGLSWNDIKEHPGTFGFETMGYNKEGIIYQYKTKSAENMKQFLKIKSPLIQSLNMTSNIQIDDREAEKITQMAFDKSYKQASLLAKTMNKDLGNILSVQENGSVFGKQYGVSLYYDRPPGEFYYDIMVTYELK